MKRFLLFAGDEYYPLGGWHDFKGDFETLEDAQTWFLKVVLRYDWAHVYDTISRTSKDLIP